jgi:F0F1-type ATP synthase delta subunit
MEPETAGPAAFELPAMVATTVDVGRLLNELEQVDEALSQLELRSGAKAVKIPKTSQLMDQLIRLNRLSILKPDDRAALKQYLAEVRTQAPVLHISFSADPTPQFIEKLISWLRTEIDPAILLTIGLQPSLGAGCVVRGNSKYFDLSLKQDFAAKRDLLLQSLRASTGAAK